MGAFGGKGGASLCSCPCSTVMGWGWWQVCLDMGGVVLLVVWPGCSQTRWGGQGCEVQYMSWQGMAQGEGWGEIVQGWWGGCPLFRFLEGSEGDAGQAWLNICAQFHSTKSSIHDSKIQMHVPKIQTTHKWHTMWLLKYLEMISFRWGSFFYLFLLAHNNPHFTIFHNIIILLMVVWRI